jgi:HSP20 family protein
MARSLLPQRLFSIPSIWEDEDWPFGLGFQDQSGLSISEDEKNVYVEAHVPGINPSDIDVTFQDGYLWIKGETRESEEDKKRKYYRRSQRSFSYRVAVPADVDMSQEPEATCRNGVMKVVLPKSAKAQPKKIAVKAG